MHCNLPIEGFYKTHWERIASCSESWVGNALVRLVFTLQLMCSCTLRREYSNSGHHLVRFFLNLTLSLALSYSCKGQQMRLLGPMVLTLQTLRIRRKYIWIITHILREGV